MNTIHIVCGLPGSGKSTYGKLLAKEQRALFLDIGTCSELLVKAGLLLAGMDPNDRDSPLFKSAFRSPIYNSLFAIALENIENVDVVFTGPFTKELQQVDWVTSLRCKFNCNVVVYYTHCSSELRHQRLLSRGNPRDVSKLQAWEKHCEYYQTEKGVSSISTSTFSPEISLPSCEHIFIDTS